jgi:hypothetical protein
MVKSKANVERVKIKRIPTDVFLREGAKGRTVVSNTRAAKVRNA